ncbi:FAD-dependent oxidoreductase [Gordonia amicalis]|uniref:NAD(P)/FAD-dependent oxidoreductase n=1 Tax=Gordonia amicalis TaxID=89053 RepID=UPI0022A7F169|nr:FAD-dependent oxidoreductase [Gordonia amicalis]MCZ0914127.1 FAD-dependent oxidoreductase [Gordonia amicalis]
MTGTLLIVGAGEAGLNIAVAAREAGHDGPVVLVGGESLGPYQRPPLSKEYLKEGEAPDPSGLELRSPEFYTDNDIDLRVGRHVHKVDLGYAGGTAVLDDGSEIVFDKLALATGSVPRALHVPGADLPGVLSLRTIGDAHNIRAELDRARHVVVIGGGFVGLEVAATAAQRGAAVTVVEAADRILARVVAPPLSEFVLEHHAAQGIRFLLQSSVAELRAADSGGVGSAVLADGTELPADLVVVGIGAIPTVDLARDLGLRCEGGVVADEFGRTDHPAVVAAGDCTVQPHPHLPGRLLGLESVNNAVEQGRSAGRVAAGVDPGRRGTPWFWSTQGELKIQIAGVSDGYDDLVVRRTEGRITVLYYREGDLIAADTVSNPRDHNAVKRALGDGHTIDRTAAADCERSLKSLVTPIS